MLKYPLHIDRVLVASHQLCKFQKFESRSKNSDKVFVMIPSIFNSAQLMFWPDKSSIIDQLLTLGDVYVVEWQHAYSSKIGVNDYALAAQQVIEQALVKQKNIVLIGHSFGCIISSIIIGLNTRLSKELIFLAPPWNFTKYKLIAQFVRYSGGYFFLKRGKYISSNLLYVALYILNPIWLYTELKRHCAKNKKSLFWQFKKWQFSGKRLSTNTARQLVEYFIEQGEWPNNWRILGVPLNLKKYKGKVSVLIGQRDKLVPVSSSIDISQSFNDCTVYKLDTGHIGCITGTKVGATFGVIKKILENE